MEFTFAIYPIVKLMLICVFAAGLVFTTTRSFYKSAITLIALWAMMITLTPIKIDGTNTQAAHKAEVSKANAYYSEHTVETLPKVVEKKLTFTERLELEENRSRKSNAEIQDGIQNQTNQKEKENK